MLSLFRHVQLSVTLWAVACQAPLSMGFSRQGYWSASCALLQGLFPTQGWKWILMSPALCHPFTTNPGQLQKAHVNLLAVLTPSPRCIPDGPSWSISPISLQPHLGHPVQLGHSAPSPSLPSPSVRATQACSPHSVLAGTLQLQTATSAGVFPTSGGLTRVLNPMSNNAPQID